MIVGNTPLNRPLLDDPTKIEKLCFTSCCNLVFLEGALGLARSIRKFYTALEADIVLFFDESMRGHTQAFEAIGCDIQWTADLDRWVIPLIYNRPEYENDRTHYYHENWKPEPTLDKTAPGAIGFNRIRNKHPLNIKAYCTGWCLVHKGYRKVVHIDSDAFILSKIDEAWSTSESLSDCVIGWDDGAAMLENYETVFHVDTVDAEEKRKYEFNAGIVFYSNGSRVHRLMLDFMFYMDSDYHWHYFRNDQGLLRALVLYHHKAGNINYSMRPASCWNPTHARADNLEQRGNVWFNKDKNSKQFMWHGAGGEKLWSGRYRSKTVNDAWKWVGGNGYAVLKPGFQVYRPYRDDHLGDRICKTIHMINAMTAGKKVAIAEDSWNSARYDELFSLFGLPTPELARGTLISVNVDDTEFYKSPPIPMMTRHDGTKRYGRIAWSKICFFMHGEKYNPKWDALWNYPLKDVTWTNVELPMSVKEAVEVIATSDWYIGPDNGLAHLAKCVGTPMILMDYRYSLDRAFPKDVVPHIRAKTIEDVLRIFNQPYIPPIKVNPVRHSLRKSR